MTRRAASLSDRQPGDPVDALMAILVRQIVSEQTAPNLEDRADRGGPPCAPQSTPVIPATDRHTGR